MMNKWTGLLALLGTAWLLSGMVMVVDTAEVAIVYRFGAVNRTAQSGLGFRLPAPIEMDERVQVTEIRRVEPGRVRLVTGDTNLVELELVVQYTVADAVLFVTSFSDPEALVAAEVASAAVGLVSAMNVDVLLTTGRADLQRRIGSNAQQALDALDAGVRLETIEVGELAPPAEVVDAFNDVSSARGDKETMILAADAYASRALPDIRGSAAKLLEDVRSEASETDADAKGEVARYKSLLTEYRLAPAATRVQLHSELLEEIGPKVDLIVAVPGTEVIVPGIAREP